MGKSYSMMGLWIGDHAQFAHPMTPTALVELRPLTRVSNPPQAISAVGVSHFHTIGGSKRGFLSDSGSRVAFSLEAAGIRHLSNLRMATRSSRAATTIGVGQHRQRQEEVRSGLIPLVSPGTRNSAGSNYRGVVQACMRMGATFGRATEDESLNRSYGSVADSPGDLPRRLINEIR